MCRIHRSDGLQGKRLGTLIGPCKPKAGVLRCTNVSESPISSTLVHVREASGNEELETVARIRAEAYYEVQYRT